MDATEIESYTYQLAQVKRELVKDPNNPELISLRDEIENLLKLVQDLQSQGVGPEPSTSKSERPTPKAGPSQQKTQAKSANTSTAESSSVTFRAGDDVMARYGNNAKFYPGRIISIGGSSENPIYTVRFRGYDSTELVVHTDIKAISEQKKRALQTEIDVERDRKRKRNEKKVENKQAKAAEQVDKQKAWQKFATKGTKKGIVIPGVAGSSMFRSPDNPYGKVGVVGSGQGMTSYAQKNKHTFTPL